MRNFRGSSEEKQEQQFSQRTTYFDAGICFRSAPVMFRAPCCAKLSNRSMESDLTYLVSQLKTPRYKVGSEGNRSWSDLLEYPSRTEFNPGILNTVLFALPDCENWDVNYHWSLRQIPRAHPLLVCSIFLLRHLSVLSQPANLQHIEKVPFHDLVFSSFYCWRRCWVHTNLGQNCSCMNISGKCSVDFGGSRILPLRLIGQKQCKESFESVFFSMAWVGQEPFPVPSKILTFMVWPKYMNKIVFICIDINGGHICIITIFFFFLRCKKQICKQILWLPLLSCICNQL